jgi:hypothetical protein
MAEKEALTTMAGRDFLSSQDITACRKVLVRGAQPGWGGLRSTPASKRPYETWGMNGWRKQAEGRR